MSSRIVHDCDRCGEEIKTDVTRFRFHVGAPQPSEGDFDTAEVELCPSCCSTSLTALVSAMYGRYDYAGNKSLLKALTDNTGQTKFCKPGSVEAANGR